MVRLPVYRLTILALCALQVGASERASAQRGSPSAADSIKYRYESTPRLEALKAEASREIDREAKLIQVMVDQVFSYGELGFQEFETSKYLTGLLEQYGFTVERGVAGIPTAFVARWGSGKPVISLGSDIDDIPQAGQKPGVGYRDMMVPGAP
jgi:aminobenzoyl-glutamate utilization protein B